MATDLTKLIRERCTPEGVAYLEPLLESSEGIKELEDLMPMLTVPPPDYLWHPLYDPESTPENLVAREIYYLLANEGTEWCVNHLEGWYTIGNFGGTEYTRWFTWGIGCPLSSACTMLWALKYTKE